MTPGKNAPNLLSIFLDIAAKNTTFTSRFQNKNVECTITTIGCSFSGFIAYRWKYVVKGNTIGNDGHMQ
jgi:hypothetical protein